MSSDQLATASNVSPDLDLLTLDGADRDSPVTPMPDAGPLSGSMQVASPSVPGVQSQNSNGSQVQVDTAVADNLTERPSETPLQCVTLTDVALSERTNSSDGGRISSIGRASAVDSAVGDLHDSFRAESACDAVSDAYAVLYQNSGEFPACMLMLIAMPSYDFNVG